MLIRKHSPSTPRPSEITPRALFVSRRRFLATGAAGALAAGFVVARAAPAGAASDNASHGAKIANVVKTPWGADEKLTDYDAITSYNNFYEFGTGKEEPSENAHLLKTRPWTVAVDGLCAKPAMIDIDTLLAANRLEERIYRMRCVEAWSMVVPWVGIPLATIIDRAEPLGSAKFVAFQTLLDPAQMPGQRRPILAWPYVEGLRLDEARHPLTLLAVGLYGEVLPNQNGAPIRVVVPWKYGFKSIKSIVHIRFVESMPPTSWNREAPQEYGFYSNVNPAVDHPRWSQKRERRIGEFFRRDTLPFNGYGAEVADLYKGMDLVKWF
jgi:sulfoxide reductase catalytic subunit YedY